MFCVTSQNKTSCNSQIILKVYRTKDGLCFSINCKLGRFVRSYYPMPQGKKYQNVLDAQEASYELPDSEGIDLAVDHDVHLALKNVEVFLHDVVIVGSEILTRLKADQREVHARTFHQILRAAAAETVFKIIFMYDKHGISSFRIY